MIKYNVKEFAELIGVSRRTIYRYIEKDIVRPRKSFTGKTFFTKEDLEIYKRKEEELCKKNIQK